jgi:hypothetical protein
MHRNPDREGNPLPSQLTTFVLAATLAACAAPAAAQIRPMSADAPPSAASRSLAPRDAARESVIAWYGELQRIGAHLQWVHDRALQDPALRAARDGLVEAVKDAMDRVDPELARLARRAADLPAEHELATRRGDAARAQALHREMAQIQARFMTVEAQVLRQPEISRQARAYEQQLRQRLLLLEPLTDELLGRSTELQRLLQGALGQGRLE